MKINITNPWLSYAEIGCPAMNGCSFCIICKTTLFPGVLHETRHQYHKAECPFFEEKNEDHPTTR